MGFPLNDNEMLPISTICKQKQTKICCLVIFVSRLLLPRNFKQADFFCIVILNKQTFTLIINVVAVLIKIILTEQPWESFLVLPLVAKLFRASSGR